MKRQWIKSLSVMLLAAVVVITAGILASARAEEYTDEKGNRFRVVPLGDGRYELWQLVDSVGGNDGEVTVVDGECQHIHRKWDKGNSQFHWEECLDCGKLFPPTVHVFDQITVVKAATCTQNAVLKRSCVCGLTEEGNTAPVTGESAEYFAHHTWGKYESNYFLGHWQVCTVCGVRGEEQQHMIGNISVTKEPTCIQDGQVSYDCTVCGTHFDGIDAGGLIADKYPQLQQYSALGHDFSGPLKVVTGTSKCSGREEGTHAASCTRCGTADYEHRTAHTWAEHTISNGTCEDENDPVIIEGTCECGATLTLKYTRHHDYVKDSSKDIEPTCTEPGKLNGERCRICGVFGNYDFANALGHDMVEDRSKRIEPTCEEPGKSFYQCSRCGETEEREVKNTKNTTGHHVYIAKTVQKAECGQTGIYEWRCKYCDERDETRDTVFETIKHDNSYTTKTTLLDLKRLDNGTIVRPEVWYTTITCARCHKVWHETHTVYKAIKGTGFKIVEGRDPGIKDLSDGEHPSGNMSKDPMWFEDAVRREMKKVLDKAMEKHEYGD